ncbi:DMT family transporter [Rubrobacter indicoceani]|uniref:DMT family transporter n=1 Tax=Rubrobacter indicoceani TaxID=2051957 RepID=UPI000E5BC02B|nr:DMT family transporter [Rubrobacter indicoceani]
MNKPVSNLVYVPLALLFSVLWASAFIAVKAALDSTTPLFLMGFRFVLAGALLLSVALVLGGIKGFRAMSPADWGRLAALGLLNNAAYLGIAAVSLQNLSGGMGAVLASVSPLMMALAALFVLDERLGAVKVSGLLIAFVSIAGIMYSRTEAGESPASMALLLLGNAFLVAGAILFKRWSPEGGLATVNGVQLLAAGLVLLPVALLFEPTGTVRWDAGFLVPLLYLTLVVSCGAMAIWFFMLRSGDAGRAGSFFFLNPVFGLILGALVLGENFRPTDLTGIAGVALGIYLVGRGG